MTQQTTPGALTGELSQTFIRFALDAGVLSFGEFVTKAGRKSPYFFNAGLFNQGAMLGQVAQFYAKTLLASGVQFDVLFGPAYKGITLASATAVALAGMGRDVGFAYNRKEAKDHGEGGTLVGAKLQGKVVIIDDVISAGTSVRESMQMIRAAGAEPAAVLIALDRMEKSGTADNIGTHSAVQDVQREYGVPVIAIASLRDLLAYLDASQDASLSTHREAVSAYRQRYGV
ncbi:MULTISPECIES: orotate phosphoribosyltransferase [Cupriavidus]|uniref:Orotate phosphoribosyltransferase n=1 Tax=Cupriavidus pauculus TaxID=82633 RepID=A0A5P2H537_9BURK|nr:orotate phosphoribosyltransferase [Cupriavidus pauculus]QET03026.1 orotate phosphoribosyltransferase [Cupriavidus pauculus]